MQHTYKYIILGGGITGIAAGRRLQQLGETDFIILEGESAAGGLCRTAKISGHYLDVGGGHVLHSKYPEVLRWVFDHIPQNDFNTYDTKILIDLEGHSVEFPIELNLWQLPADLQVEYLHSYLTSASKDIKYDNFESWIRNYLGDKIANNYMIPYNKKLWCMDISKLNTDWLVKIPKTDIKLVLKSIIERNPNFTEAVVSHKSFYYPKSGGFQSIFDAIAGHIKQHIKTKVKIKTLRYDKPKSVWHVNEQYTAQQIITTIPWTAIDVMAGGFDYKSEIKNLEYLSNVISLWQREPYYHNAHWKYIPNSNIEHHREFYIHNFAPYSKAGGVMTDINRIRWLQNNRIWQAGLPLFEQENIYSYPLPTKTYQKSINKILDFSREHCLYGLGRWGQWQYLNIDQCIKQVLEFFSNNSNKNYFKIF